MTMINGYLSFPHAFDYGKVSLELRDQGQTLVYTVHSDQSELRHIWNSIVSGLGTLEGRVQGVPP